MVGTTACGAEVTQSATVQPTASADATDLPTASDLPHQGVITVVDVVQGPSSEMSQHMVAIRLSGDVGTSAIFRSLEIRARMQPIDGSACDGTMPPTVLRASHPDAVQPALADQTRTVVVRRLADAAAAGGSGRSARFRVGPVPSLNGGFEGWVSFHFPADSAAGFCAFDVSGVVVIVAGETTTAELPVVRVDTRVQLDGG
ncbi:MAG TPA: hypothetical protein VF365_08270 [Candidatus Limnocylindria bacterium]